jgi:8-oxo-dGTP pyrophosphatase MutT (NUDIX family)
MLKESGVLVVVFPSGEELFTCLIRRPSHMKEHAGQIGFPGGKIEKTDDGPLEAAIRECHEEVGLDPKEITILGSLSSLYIPVSRFLIYPFVAWCPSVPMFKPNASEVEKVLLFPLLFHSSGAGTEWTKMQTFTGWMDVPSIPFEGEIIWGATAMILSEFLEVLASAQL